MEENEKIIIKKDGKEVACDILFTFDCEETQKGYIGYTDHSLDKKGRKNIYVSSFDPILGMKVLEDIETEQEKEMIQDVLRQIRGE